MRVKQIIGAALAVAVAGLSGCQAWPGANFPLQNATRVPPPGTGTYPLPSGYYNNAAGPAPSGQAQATGSIRPTNPSGTLPTTNLPATQSYAQNSFVSNANFTAPDSSRFTAANSAPPVVPSSGVSSLNDTSTADVPSLQWQQQ